MDFIVEGIEALFNVFYLRVGKTLFGAEFSESPKSFPLNKRITAGAVSLLIVLSIAIAFWFAIALAFQ